MFTRPLLISAYCTSCVMMFDDDLTLRTSAVSHRTLLTHRQRKHRLSFLRRLNLVHQQLNGSLRSLKILVDFVTESYDCFPVGVFVQHVRCSVCDQTSFTTTQHVMSLVTAIFN